MSSTAAPQSLYADRLRALFPDLDPRHVEAFMRLEHGTLDHFHPDSFALEARVSAICVREVGAEEAEDCAQSFGL